MKEIGVRRWQYDLWYQIISAAVQGDPDSVPLNWHSAFKKPAAMRYTASSPQLLNWVKLWNKGRPYEQQIQPFGFLQAYMPRTGPFASLPERLTDGRRRGRPSKTEHLAPIAPYDSDPARALSKVFDRVNGKAISPEQLKPMRRSSCSTI